MVGASHLEIARQMWGAVSSGSPDPVLAFAPSVVWRTCGRGVHAGQYHGIDEILQYLAASAEGVSALHSELIDIFSSEQGAIIHYRVDAERGPKNLEGQYFLWLRIEDGVVQEVVVIPWDQAGNDVFWRTD